jgi:site-specific recombinase XerD
VGTRQTLTAPARAPDGYPSADELAALRGWYAGLSARDAVERYLGARRATGQSSRAMLSSIRVALARFARARHRDDLAGLFDHAAAERGSRQRAVLHAIDKLRNLPIPQPQITDATDRWLSPRVSAALRAENIRTLADLTVRVPRRRRWWTAIPKLGATGAHTVEAFFSAHPHLTESARALVATPTAVTRPWEGLVVPTDLDGSRGTFRAPRATCALDADDDHAAVHAWLELQESPATRRAYCKEAERLMLWALVERGRALSSLTTEDAIAYRAFLRKPMPRDRWIGPTRPRASHEWRPFAGPLSPRSAAYALSVIGALYRWLIEQRYLLANPFAGVKVKSAKRVTAIDADRGFSPHEWSLVRSVADGIEWSDDWSQPAAQRLKFLLDFWHATGLRPHEIVSARLGDVGRDDHGDDWLHVIGKGQKEGNVAVPLSALAALEGYLVQRGLPVTRSRWDPSVPLVPTVEGEGGITASRLWAVFRRFFSTAAEQLQEVSPSTAEKLKRATPHWLRHTHATHALAAGAELTTVRDNLRHASVATTSVYLHTDQVKRARQMRKAFPVKR